MFYDLSWKPSTINFKDFKKILEDYGYRERIIAISRIRWIKSPLIEFNYHIKVPHDEK